MPGGIWGVLGLAVIAAMVYDFTRKGSQGAQEIGTVNGVATHVFGDLTGA